jgi:anti-sigma-K factor RskA
MNAEDHRRWEDELAAWMLGALEEREAEEFERHLAQCERCRTDLNWLRPAVDAIPASVTQVAAPPRLRGELLGTVRAEARRAATPRGTSRWLAGLRVPRPAIAALGVAILVAAGVAGYTLGVDSEGEETFTAQPSKEATGASAELVVDGDSGTLHASGLPPLQRDEVFQAWIRNSGETELRPSDVFRPAQGGEATASLEGLEDAAQVMVTREPRGGSAQPTSTPLLKANL